MTKKSAQKITSTYRRAIHKDLTQAIQEIRIRIASFLSGKLSLQNQF